MASLQSLLMPEYQRFLRFIVWGLLQFARIPTVAKPGRVFLVIRSMGWGSIF